MSTHKPGDGAPAAASRTGGGGLAARLGPGGAGAVGDDRTGADALGTGLAALADGRWQDAVHPLEHAVAAATGPARAEAAEGLGEALWWLGRVEDALAARARAYECWRALGDDAAACRTAAWLAREYAAAVGNDAASAGWLARARTLAEESSSPAVHGWVALTRALLAAQPDAQADAARAALEHARAARDGDLEALALGRLGLAWIAAGRLDDGLSCVDEAMAAATGGEADLPTLAALCCEVVVAAELSGEVERFARWNEVVESLAARRGHPPLVAFCATCCAEAFAATGDWEGAEQQLRAALGMLRRTGHRARCVPPAAKLADLLVSQGRLEEAEEALAGDRGDASLLVRARLALARGAPAAAISLADRHRRRRGGDSLFTAPAVAFLVEAHLASGDVAAADDAAARLAGVAAASGHGRTLGRAAAARARVASARGDEAAAAGALEEALDHLATAAPGAIETAEAHLALARLRAGDAAELAAAEARQALEIFEGAGAGARADEAAALLRSLGDRSRVGAKDVGVLTRREQEVLRLVARGLTNAEIAGRLFISTKTAGNHVSSILAKLGLRSRVEAAAYAALHAPD